MAIDMMAELGTTSSYYTYTYGAHTDKYTPPPPGAREKEERQGDWSFPRERPLHERESKEPKMYIFSKKKTPEGKDPVGGGVCRASSYERIQHSSFHHNR